jgi:ferredoxin-NADP reductase
VLDTSPETKTAKTIRLDVPGWPGHLAGQHVDVRLTAEDGYQAQRSYSIATPPEDVAVALTVQRIADGEVSPYITEELRPGDDLELRGPIGGYFTWQAADGGPLLLLAGGSGLVPLMAMLRQRAAAGDRTPAALLASWRSIDDVIYRDELEALSARVDELRVTHTLTRTQPEGWQGFRRRIDRPMLAEVIAPFGEPPLAYICGPTLLVEAAATALVDLGVPAARVRTERFGPTS